VKTVGEWNGTGFGHEGFFFADRSELAARCVPYVEEGLDLGQPLVVVTSPATLELLGDAFGVHTSTFTVFASTLDWWKGSPSLTLLAWMRAMHPLLAEGEPWRVLGEPMWESLDPHRVWCRLEAASNQFFAQAPYYSLCLHDCSHLEAQTVADARATHPLVWNGRGTEVSRAYRSPVEFIRDTEPVVIEAPRDALTVTVTTTSAARHAVAAATAVLEDQRRERVSLAVSELTANALAVIDRVTVTAWDDGTTFYCNVIDDGPGFDAMLAGYAPPLPELPSGRGLWLARALVDDLTIRSSATGTTAQLQLLLA
jgi:anti-sigma regulatory factor (Ser/Thr protein kinase)